MLSGCYPDALLRRVCLPLLGCQRMLDDPIRERCHDLTNKFATRYHCDERNVAGDHGNRPRRYHGNAKHNSNRLFYISFASIYLQCHSMNSSTEYLNN